MRFFLIVFIVFFHTSLWAKAAFIPDKDTYKDFLIEGWKEGAPSIIAMKDPNCGYCIRALKNMAQYKHYNVFMFWSPILGKSSDNKVDRIFSCDQPIGEDVFTSVIKREKISCERTDKLTNQRRKLRDLNNSVVSHFNPQSVPAYYFGNNKVRLNALTKFKENINNTLSSVRLDWDRYDTIKVDKTIHKGLANAVVFVSDGFKKKQALVSLLQEDPRYNWYIASKNCQYTGCRTDDKGKASEELRILLNINSKELLTVAVNGVVIRPERYKFYQLEPLISLIRDII